MKEQPIVGTNLSVCATVAHQGNMENSSSKVSLAHETQTNEPATSPSSMEDDLLLDLAIRHFRDLNLRSAESDQLSAGILQAVATGEPHFAGPVGEPSRRYEFHWRFAALSIRVGEGRISLPLQSALHLANALQGASDPQLAGAIAA
jgi:hypothetical protein